MKPIISVSGLRAALTTFQEQKDVMEDRIREYRRALDLALKAELLQPPKKSHHKGLSPKQAMWTPERRKAMSERRKAEAQARRAATQAA
jgi:hypothetical protein